MDAQKLSQLDPKLRDAYQRVMGTVIPEPTVPNQSPTPPVNTPTTPTPNPTPQPAVPPVVDPQPVVNPQSTPQPTPEPASQQPTSNFTQMNSTVAAAPALNSPNFSAPAAPIQNTAVFKKKSGLTPILFIIAGIFFIGIYTLFWIKIFNLQVPFLQ